MSGSKKSGSGDKYLPIYVVGVMFSVVLVLSMALMHSIKSICAVNGSCKESDESDLKKKAEENVLKAKSAASAASAASSH